VRSNRQVSAPAEPDSKDRHGPPRYARDLALALQVFSGVGVEMKLVGWRVRRAKAKLAVAAASVMEVELGGITVSER